MKSLMKYLKDYKKECVLSPLFKLLEATFELFVPLVMAAVIDKGIGHADKPYIVKMCLVLIALGIIGLVCSITAQFFAAKAAVGFATKETEEISDYFGVVSGNKEDKIAKSGVHVTKSNFVEAPIIEEYPLTLECTVDSFENGELIGTVVNCSVDEEYLDKNGNIDVDKMEIITFDMVSNTYRVLGDVVGKAFKDGLKLKD